jgi:hypothetical protein
VISDLLHIYLRLATNEATFDAKTAHSQLDLATVEPQQLFALQLLHRWCVRVVVFAKFARKPPVKSTPIALPGVLNPLQQMKEANDNILKVLTTNVLESVEFLEKCAKSLDSSGEGLVRPTSDCFSNISAETGGYELEWANSTRLEQEFIKQFVSFAVMLLNIRLNYAFQ